MGIFRWTTTIHWVELLQSLGIISGFFFTAYTVRADSRERKIQTVFEVTAAHREIWSTLYEYPHLARILDPDAGKVISPSTDERLFVHFLILHLAASYRAKKLGMDFKEEGLRDDIHDFFALPIPKAVWEKSKKYQDTDFVEFVESCL